MKNRILKISAWITVAALVFSLSVYAMADSVGTENVVIQAGDTLASVCASRGVDFYSNRERIMKLNGFTDYSQLNVLDVGDVICIPSAAKNDVVLYSTGNATGKTFAASDIKDVPVYYVILYRLGDNCDLENIYRGWELNFTAYIDRILAFNHLTDLSSVTSDQYLLLPVNRTDIYAEGYYTVYEHTVKAGETIGTICARHGVDSSQFSDTLAVLNPGVDLNRLYIDQKIYFPVSGVASDPGPTSNVASSVYGNVSSEPAPAVAVETPCINPVLPNIETLYTGYGVVISVGKNLQVRLENEGCDVYLTYNPSVLGEYAPRPGDYIGCTFTPTDFLLASVSYVYNVFDN